jgi:hypothetical protein
MFPYLALHQLTWQVWLMMCSSPLTRTTQSHKMVGGSVPYGMENLTVRYRCSK